MRLPNFLTNGLKFTKQHSPEILTAMGVSGVITTAYLASKATHEADNHLSSQAPVEDWKDRARRTWKFYIPAGVSGGFTIGCIIGASRASGNRTTAAVAAYSLTEKAFSEYREKVAEEFTKNKEQKIRDDIVQDRVNAKPPGKDIIIVGTGGVLCCELYTHRYFRSDMEALRKAQNDLNVWIVNAYNATLDDFYSLIGLEPTSESAHLGWDSERLVELEFSTVLAENNEPCLAFAYNYVKPL